VGPIGKRAGLGRVLHRYQIWTLKSRVVTMPLPAPWANTLDLFISQVPHPLVSEARPCISLEGRVAVRSRGGTNVPLAVEFRLHRAPLLRGYLHGRPDNTSIEHIRVALLESDQVRGETCGLGSSGTSKGSRFRLSIHAAVWKFWDGVIGLVGIVPVK
jgi:hypothetical protein